MKVNDFPKPQPLYNGATKPKNRYTTSPLCSSHKFKMYNLDTRFVVPALLNLALSLLQQHQGKPWLPSPPSLNMNWKIWFFSIVILLLFLITSARLPLSLRAGRIRVRAGDFSFFLLISLLGSVLLPLPIFWFGYTTILCISPWHSFLSGLLMQFLFSVWDILCNIPVLIITCMFQNRQQDETETDPPPPQVLVADDDIDIRGNPILPEQPPSKLITVVVQPLDE
ncbi:hypothetical protein RHSIM_RhsimUnG0170500 [Rhododendron simsii]|uniref:Uncharacterized protein n=1 Tax=Rhododendron simsii TaxID=118357 RepID=A0A834FUN6_RHOSS|nr:hypothetical protein RHSIM_RhsimUnG0170500 [Rhododendron simsii]